MDGEDRKGWLSLGLGGNASSSQAISDGGGGGAYEDDEGGMEHRAPFTLWLE